MNTNPYRLLATNPTRPWNALSRRALVSAASGGDSTTLWERRPAPSVTTQTCYQRNGPSLLQQLPLSGTVGAAATTTRTRAYSSSHSVFEESSSSNDKTTTAKALHMSMFKNPIVQKLWMARQEAKDRRQREAADKVAGADANNKDEAKHDEEIPPKFPSESRVEVSYPFSSDPLLQATYQNPWGQLRFGRLMEDLDALAGNIAYFHNDRMDHNGGAHHKTPVIVTASFDRLRLRRRPLMDCDQTLSGQVTWTGTSSMEIRMQCMDAGCAGGDRLWMEAYVTFVTLDPDTHRPAPAVPLQPQTALEKGYYEEGTLRAAKKKERRKRQKQHAGVAVPEVETMAQSLLAEAAPLINMPSLANPNDILMASTKIQDAMVTQPQYQNLHSRIFGGFLMRRAFELAYANAYMFGGARPAFLELDEVSFHAPVDVGDLVVFNSRIVYTDTGRIRDFLVDDTVPDPAILLPDDQEIPLVHVEVEAWVTIPEKATARLSNQFYFTFGCSTASSIRRVLPANIDEARRMAHRIVEDQETQKR